MANQHADFLLIGGGLANAMAAETLRREGATGSVLLVSAEQRLPYHRPALSKRYLLGEADDVQIFVHSEQFYREHEIGLALDTRVVSVNPAEQHIETSDGQEIGYGKLLIATGVRPKRFVGRGASLGRVYTLRSVEDGWAIRQAASDAESVAIVGGSFLGMELAMSLRELGLNVTVIERDDRLLRHLESDKLAEFFRRHAQAYGVSVRLGDGIVALYGDRDVKEVETFSGARIACDFVVACVGVEPATEFLGGSGIALEARRIVVDEQLRTSVANVFAAGDAVSFFDPVFQRRRHIEHWDNAVKQGRLAAMNMLDKRMRYDQVSYFFCEVGDISFDVLGDPLDTDERIGRGALDQRSFAQFYLKNDVPRAVFSFGRPPSETRLVEGLIRYRTNVHDEKERLHDPDFVLDQLASQTVLILQGGGALGAFECGVVRALEQHQIYPQIVAGISIGALNGAIIASNPRNATAALESFWSELQVASPQMPSEELRRATTAMQILQFGVPEFFRPRWMFSFDRPWVAPWNWTSFYDTTPMKRLLTKYVDFQALGTSPVRLLVGAVNVLNAELEVFDSYVDELTPDHILASGSLPPGFSWTFVNGKPYWDGGVVSNSPLDLVIDRCGPDGKRVFIVDLFAGEKALPKNMMEVMARRDEIVYSERVRNDLRTRELTDAYRGLIRTILDQLEPAVREKITQRPRYIQLMGDGVQTSVVRFVREGPPGEPSSRDYDFSDVAIQLNQARGYEHAMNVLARKDPGESLKRLQVQETSTDFHLIKKPDVIVR
ncbi:FAD-dependent oxidoreductase [Caballeronia sp. LZ001]|uniref:FAD-dependent oxidoreductase n=1 Tax=Caballeronia sp. LZ001 TaxID=3038553 RepID=UPI00285B77E9|nr:FAD-dependent oxidoreductase [Caballeronia sp. LZ001]MDR5804805.1 FAD-dependent oxidoreductase [Caballeronia sp. LZ001]